MYQCIRYWFVVFFLVICVLISIADINVDADITKGTTIHTDQVLSDSNVLSVNKTLKRVLVYGSALSKTMLILQLSPHIKFFSNTWLQDKSFRINKIANKYSQTLSDDFQTIPININRERLLYHHIDFIVGSWHDGGFGNYVWMIPEYLSTLNIGSYVSGSNVCERFQNRFLCDLSHLGDIFGVSDRASKIIDQYQTLEKKIVNSIDDTFILPSVLIFRGKFKQGNSYIGGINNFFTHLLSKYNWSVIHPGVIFSRDWIVIKDEFILQQDPDLIIIVGDNHQSLLQDLYDSQILRSLSAVKQQRIVWLTYDEATASPDYLQGLNKIYKALKSIQKRK